MWYFWESHALTRKQLHFLIFIPLILRNIWRISSPFTWLSLCSFNFISFFNFIVHWTLIHRGRPLFANLNSSFTTKLVIQALVFNKVGFLILTLAYSSFCQTHTQKLTSKTLMATCAKPSKALNYFLSCTAIATQVLLIWCIKMHPMRKCNGIWNTWERFQNRTIKIISLKIFPWIFFIWPIVVKTISCRPTSWHKAKEFY